MPSRQGARAILAVSTLLVGLGLVSGRPQAHGQSPSPSQSTAPPAVGTSVVLKAGAALKLGDKEVDTGQSHRVYRVDRVSDGWLWLVAGGVAGWARSADVILLDQAIAVYTAEIQRNPHAPWPYFNRGLIHQDRRDTDKALADYSAALRQAPDFVPALINRGNLWLARRSVDRAITDFSDAITNDPKSILAHVNRGIAWQAKHDYDKALGDYDEAIRLGLKTAAAFNNRGHVREMKNDPSGAIADYTEAIALDPNYLLAWMNRGNARYATGQYAEALADYAEAIRLAPQSPWSYARRAWILATCADAQFRDGKEAVALALKASELSEQKQASILDIRAAAHAEAEDFAKAIFWETKAIAMVARAASEDATTYRSRLALYQKNTPYRQK